MKEFVCGAGNNGGTELATVNKSGSVTTFAGAPPKPVKFGSNSSTSPVDITIPLFKPRLVLIAPKNPICILSPWYV